MANPRHLGEPVNYLPNASGPYGIAFNKRNEVIVKVNDCPSLTTKGKRYEQFHSIKIVHT